MAQGLCKISEVSKKIRVNNFASENERMKKKGKIPSAETEKKRAESLRNLSIRIIIVVAENTNFELRHIFRYPNKTYPFSLAHADGALLKTRKYTY